MSAQKRNAEDTTGREFIVDRVINAPKDLVFEAYTDPKHLGLWFGPNGFSVTTQSHDFKVGGSWKFVMHGPDGTNYDNFTHYKEIEKPKRIVYDHGGDGGKVHFKVTINFEELGPKKTKLTMHSVFPTAEAFNTVVEQYGAIEGAKQNMLRLADYAENLSRSGGTEPFVIRRTFKAPMDLMFKIWTDPEHLKNWFGPKGATTGYIKTDLRPGGMHHYCMMYNGVEIWGKFIYREIVPPEKIVWVNSFSDAKGGTTSHPMSPTWPKEMLTTVTFTQHLEFTTVKVEWVPINASQTELETFEAGRASMNQGWGGTLEQLDQYLAERPAKG